MAETKVLNDWSNLSTQIKRFIYSRVRDKHLAEDIFQESFLKVFTNIHTLRDEAKLSSWIFSIVRNEITDHFKQQIKILKHWEQEEQNNFYNQQLKDCIIPFIHRLPDKYREALLLVEIENLSQKELAQRLKISYSGAKSRVQRGREKLRELFLECCEIKHDKYGNILSLNEKPSCCSNCN